MANRWEKVGTVTDFIFLGSKITVDSDCCCCCYVASVVSDSVRPHRWQPTRLPRPWDSPGKNTGVGCHFLLCSHEIERCLLLGRKAMTNIDSILKSRDIILPTKVHLVEDMFFPVVMYECESWTIKEG